MGVVSSLIDAFGTGLNNQIEYNRNKNMMRMQNDFNVQNANMERNWSLEDRAHEEAYNSPIQQAQRLRMAGMSPMDYMGEPVSTSTAEDSVNSASALSANGKKANISFEDKDISDLVNHRNQEKTDVALDLQRSEAELNRAQAKDISGEGGIQTNRLAFDKEKWQTEKDAIEESIFSSKLDDQMKKQAYKHNERMYEIEENVGTIREKYADEMAEWDLKATKSKVYLTNSEIKNLGQQYIMNGPEAYYAQLTEYAYGKKADTIVKTVMEKTESDRATAYAVMADAVIEEGVINGDFGKNVQTLWNGRHKLASTKSRRGGDSGVLRGAVGAFLRGL